VQKQIQMNPTNQGKTFYFISNYNLSCVKLV